jgi:predicted MFS family arabinose efflux permease
VHVASPDSHRAHILSLYIFVTAAATPIGALIWGAVANLVGIDPVVGGAGVILMLAIAATLIAVARKRVPVVPDRDPRPARTA